MAETLYHVVKVLPTVSPFRPSFLQPPAVHRATNGIFAPLFSTSSELLFSQLLCFHIYLRCPLLFSANPNFHVCRSASTPSSCNLPAVRGLRALVLSCLSFSHSFPLFSIACSLPAVCWAGLFSRNTRGMGTPDDSAGRGYLRSQKCGSLRSQHKSPVTSHRSRHHCGKIPPFQFGREHA
jgi:hypothetical protein